ncbi:hypothetical protein Tco_1153592 [Tanacetum coccineum]
MEAPQKTVDGHHRSTHRRSRSGLCLDEGLYALACEEDVRCLATLVRSFKLIEVYIEHGVTALDSYLRAPRFRATIEEITDEPSSIATNRTGKMLLLTCMSLVKQLRNLFVNLSHLALCHNMIQVHLLSGVHGVDTQSHVLSIIQSHFNDINLSIVSQQATASQVIDDVMRQLSFDETELDGETGFADVAGSGVDSSGLSHDESFGVDDLDLNLNKPINLNISQVETQSEFPVSEKPNVSRTREPILIEVSTQEPIVAECGRCFDDEGIDTIYETEYDVQSSEDAGTDDYDDVDEDFLVDKENEIIEPDIDVHLFGISMDLPFDNIGVTNLVSDDILEGEDVDVINADGFDSDPGNDEETNHRKRRLAELRTEMKGVINASGQWKYSFYTGKKFTTPKEAKDRVYLHSIKSRRNLKLYKNDGVRIRARCDEKVPVFTMLQGIRPISPNREMEVGPSGSSGPTTMSKKGKNTSTNDDSQASSSVLDVHDKGDLCPWILVNLDIPVKAVQDSSNYSMLRDYVVKLQSTNHNTTVKIAVERNTNPSLPTKVYQRIYVCLGALKLGFRACRRDLLGLDNAFMKGPSLGQVLVAVGLDSNNGIYPLAYVLVEAESKSSSCWFLQCLGDDIDLHPNLNFTFISDRQKVFNGNIVEGRDKPVITLLEYIKEYCMKRIVNVQGVIDKCTGPLTPTATRIMKSIKKEAHLMKEMGIDRDSLNTRHNKATCKGQGQKATTGVNNAEASGSASKQAQQTEPAVGQDGLGGQVAGALSNNGNFPMVKKEEVTSKKLSPMAEEMIMLIEVEKLADGWRTIVSYFVEKAMKKYADDE